VLHVFITGLYIMRRCFTNNCVIWFITDLFMRYLCVVMKLLTESFHMLFMLITVTFHLIQVLWLKRKLEMLLLTVWLFIIMIMIVMMSMWIIMIMYDYYDEYVNDSSYSYSYSYLILIIISKELKMLVNVQWNGLGEGTFHRQVT